jgi:hypothetical protein
MQQKQRSQLIGTSTNFSMRGTCAGVFWGLMQGLESEYQVVFVPETQQMRCSCWIFPKPCVHSLALAFLFEQESDKVFEIQKNAPEWTETLLSGKAFSISKKQNNEVQNALTREKKYLERIEKTFNGFDDLEQWLLDTMKRGLATTISENPTFYEDIAARMADNSMTGISRFLRLLKNIPTNDPLWADKTLRILGEMALSVRAFRNREKLPETLIADLQVYIGINAKKEEALQGNDIVKDTWAVLGVNEVQVEDKLKGRYTWLLGASSGRFALLLEYVYGGIEFSAPFQSGSIFMAEFAFYSSAMPIRAILKNEPKFLTKRIEKLPGFATFDALGKAYSQMLGKQPWIRTSPFILENVKPLFLDEKFFLEDSFKKIMPLECINSVGWKLIALSCDFHITVFGEWNGQAFLPISAVADGRFVELA